MPIPEVLIPVGIELAKKIPVGKVTREPKRKFGELYREVRGQSPQPVSSTNKNTPQSGVSDPEVLDYQKRELGKSLLLLQKHLSQKCRINGKACSCCQKHPMEIEALSDESVGISALPIFSEIGNWARHIAPVTTEQAAGSGQYDEQYPKLAEEARNLRVKLMGTENVMALLSPEERQAVGK